MARAEGLEDILRYCQVSVNENFANASYDIVVEFKDQILWRWQAGMGRDTLMNDEVKALHEASAVMRGNLSIVGQMHFVFLAKHFPGAIKEVTVEYSPNTHSRIILVHFKNGHVADSPESEVKSDFFLAKCGMLFNLPPL